MKTKPQHTPTPLCVSNYLDTDDIGILGKDGEIVVAISKQHRREIFDEIVRAVNSHEALLKAANRAIAALQANGAPNCEAVKELKQAIAQAEAQS